MGSGWTFQPDPLINFLYVLHKIMPTVPLRFFLPACTNSSKVGIVNILIKIFFFNFELYCKVRALIFYHRVREWGEARSIKWTYREIQLTRPALPYDYSCFADGYSIWIRNIQNRLSYSRYIHGSWNRVSQPGSRTNERSIRCGEDLYVSDVTD